jgi:transposase-like protein
MNQEKPEGRSRKKRYTEEFRRSVNDHWQGSGKTGAEIAQEFGVSVWNLRDWKRQYGSVAKPVDAPMPKTPEEMSRRSSNYGEN